MGIAFCSNITAPNIRMMILLLGNAIVNESSKSKAIRHRAMFDVSKAFRSCHTIPTCSILLGLADMDIRDLVAKHEISTLLRRAFNGTDSQTHFKCF